MPNIDFTLLDNTSRDITTVEGQPAGVVVPLPINAASLDGIPLIDEFDTLESFTNALNGTYKDKILKIESDTYISTDEMIKLLLKNGFRVITCTPAAATANDRATATTTV